MSCKNALHGVLVKLTLLVDSDTISPDAQHYPALFRKPALPYEVLTDSIEAVPWELENHPHMSQSAIELSPRSICLCKTSWVVQRSSVIKPEQDEEKFRIGGE